MAGAQACRHGPNQRVGRAAARDDGLTTRRQVRSGWAWWAALWLFGALLLTGIGVVIATSLESGLLGFLGADFVFLVAMSIYTSGQNNSSQGRR